MGNEESQPSNGPPDTEDEVKQRDDYSALARERKEEAEATKSKEHVDIDKLTPEQRDALGTVHILI